MLAHALLLPPLQAHEATAPWKERPASGSGHSATARGMARARSSTPRSKPKSPHTGKHGRGGTPSRKSRNGPPTTGDRVTAMFNHQRAVAAATLASGGQEESLTPAALAAAKARAHLDDLLAKMKKSPSTTSLMPATPVGKPRTPAASPAAAPLPPPSKVSSGGGDDDGGGGRASDGVSGVADAPIASTPTASTPTVALASAPPAHSDDDGEAGVAPAVSFMSGSDGE